MLFFPYFCSLTFVPKISEHVRTSMPRRGDAVPHHIQLLVAQHASLRPRWNVVIEIRSFVYLLLLCQFEAGISMHRRSRFGDRVVIKGAWKKIKNCAHRMFILLVDATKNVYAISKYRNFSPFLFYFFISFSALIRASIFERNIFIVRWSYYSRKN